MGGGAAAGGAVAGGAVGGGSTDGGTDAGSRCDAVLQTGCPTAQRCLLDTFDGGSNCVSPGTAAIDDPCTSDEQCNGNAICWRPTCRPLCNDSTQKCPPNSACFPVGVGSIGVCLPTCDPVTLVRLSDGAANCGSTSSAGCYAQPTVDAGIAFACAAAPANAPAHGEPARLGSTGQPFANGCRPGAFPFFVARTGSATTVCTATCRPKPTSTASSLDAGGLEPYSCSMRGAPNAECRYLDFWLPMSTRTNYGVCYDYQNFTWDHDGNTNTAPVPTPSCRTLPPADAGAWGCLPL